MKLPFWPLTFVKEAISLRELRQNMVDYDPDGILAYRVHPCAFMITSQGKIIWYDRQVHSS